MKIVFSRYRKYEFPLTPTERFPILWFYVFEILDCASFFRSEVGFKIMIKTEHIVVYKIELVHVVLVMILNPCINTFASDSISSSGVGISQ